jgi:hypothetical protein
VWIVASVIACDPVCNIARVKVIASDGRAGVPCVVELQDADGPLKPPYRGGPKTHTGAVFTERTYRGSGRYRLAFACEGYRLSATPEFGWTLEGRGCGRVNDLGVITVDPE